MLCCDFEVKCKQKDHQVTGEVVCEVRTADEKHGGVVFVRVPPDAHFVDGHYLCATSGLVTFDYEAVPRSLLSVISGLILTRNLFLLWH